MGGGSWTSGDWDSFKSTATVDRKTGRTKSVDEIFAHGMRKDFDPKDIKVRESFDSADNPNSTPVIVGLDVTGSMGHIPHDLITNGLNRMASEIIDRKPVTDPHLMFMAIGDSYYDTAPLQVTQFEADIRIAEQLKDLYIESGGGDSDESYHLPWYFAARKTDIDCFSKRGQKGYLFTIGDAGCHPKLEKSHIKKVFNDAAQSDLTNAQLLKMAEERYEVFHLIVTRGSDFDSGVAREWKELLGERAIPVSDYTKVPEVIVSTLQVMAGKSKADVVKSWSGSTALVVGKAISGLSEGRAVAKRAASGGAVWRPGVK